MATASSTKPRKPASRKTPTRKSDKSASAATTGTTAPSEAKRKTPPAAAAAARRSQAAKAKTADTPPAATVVTDKPVVAGPDLRKADFIDAVVTRTGLKKRDVKPAVEAAMALLGEALEDGREITFPELGKLKVNREKELSTAKVIICKLRRPKPKPQTGADPLAKAAE